MKKIISRWATAVLILASLLLIFVPWYSTDDKNSIESIVSTIELINSLSENEFEASAIEDIDRCINDGKLSAFECFKANIDIKKIVSSYNETFGELTEKDETIIKMCKTDIFIFVITIALGIFALLSQIKKPVFIVPLLYFLSETIFVFWGIDSAVDFFSYFSKELFLEFSIGPTAWPYVSIALVFFALIISFLHSNTKYELPKIPLKIGKKLAETSEPVWFCPRCGNKNKLNYRYCDHCGLQKAGEMSCQNCGGPVTASQTFCPKCGTKLTDDF